LLAGIVPPVGSNVLLSVGVVPSLDPTPVAFVVTTFILAAALLSRDFIRVVTPGRYRAVETMDDPMVTVDTDATVVDCNPAMRDLVGVGDGWHGTSVASFFTPYPGVVERVEDGDWDDELVLDDEGGERVFDPTFRPFAGRRTNGNSRSMFPRPLVVAVVSIPIPDSPFPSLFQSLSPFLSPGPVAVDAPATVLPPVVRHLALAAGIPGLLCLALVAALLSVGDAFSLPPGRRVAVVGAILGGGSLVLGVAGVVAGVAWSDAAALVGGAVLGLATAVALLPGSVGFGRLVVAPLASAAALGVALDLGVPAFGWGGSLGIPLQSVAMVLPGAVLPPLGFAARRRHPARWVVAAVVVTSPFLVAAPLVPVGGLGPFFVAMVMLPWVGVLATASPVLFGLGWVAAEAGASSDSTPDSNSGDDPDLGSGAEYGSRSDAPDEPGPEPETEVGPRLPRVPVARLAGGVVATGGLGTALALGGLPELGLLVVPLVPIPAACLGIGVLVLLRPGAAADHPLVGVVAGTSFGVVALLARGILATGVEYVPHVLRPPSLVLSSVALAMTALSFFPLGVAVGRRSEFRWAYATGIVLLPVATVVASLFRPWNLAGPFLAATFSVVAVLLGVPLFRLGLLARTRTDVKDERGPIIEALNRHFVTDRDRER